MDNILYLSWNYEIKVYSRDRNTDWYRQVHRRFLEKDAKTLNRRFHLKTEILRDFDSMYRDDLPCLHSKTLKPNIEFKWGESKTIYTDANIKIRSSKRSLIQITFCTADLHYKKLAHDNKGSPNQIPLELNTKTVRLLPEGPIVLEYLKILCG